MGWVSAFDGFFGWLLAFRLAGPYVEERSAFIATLSIWWASSLTVCMYFNPSWSHAPSAFAVALFLWYWHETRSSRSPAQWLILGLIAGLMLNIYYANAMVLAVLAVEALRQYLSAFRRDPRVATSEVPRISDLLVRRFLFASVILICLLPTFITRYIVFGSAFESAYIPIKHWLWFSPAL